MCQYCGRSCKNGCYHPLRQGRNGAPRRPLGGGGAGIPHRPAGRLRLRGRSGPGRHGRPHRYAHPVRAGGGKENLHHHHQRPHPARAQQAHHPLHAGRAAPGKPGHPDHPAGGHRLPPPHQHRGAGGEPAIWLVNLAGTSWTGSASSSTTAGTPPPM